MSFRVGCAEPQAQSSVAEQMEPFFQMTNKIKIGTRAPAFTLPDENGKSVKLSDFRGKKVILYFYPKDDTPG